MSPEFGSANIERSGRAFLPLHPRAEYLQKRLEGGKWRGGEGGIPSSGDLRGDSSSEGAAATSTSSPSFFR